MKKVLGLVLIVAMLVGCVCAFVACNDNGDNEVKYIDIELTSEDYAIGVNKADTELLANVNTYISTIKSNGVLNSFIEKAGNGTLEAITSAAEGTANALTVYTNAAFPPFESTQGEKFVGIDMSIAKGIADSLGKALIIKNIDFDNVCTSVQNNTGTLAIAGLTITETRSEIINFSESYYTSAQVVIAKKGDTTFDGCQTIEDVEAKIKALAKGTKIGYQNGTTGNFYVVGDAGFGFDGFSNVTGKGYDSGALAVQDLINGNISYVVIDKEPAKSIVAASNKVNG